MRLMDLAQTMRLDVSGTNNAGGDKVSAGASPCPTIIIEHIINLVHMELLF